MRCFSVKRKICFPLSLPWHWRMLRRRPVHHVSAGSAMAALWGLPELPSMYTVCSAALWCLRGAGQGEGMAEAMLFSSKNCPTSQKIQVPQRCICNAKAYKLLFSLAKGVTKASRHRWLQYKLKRQKEEKSLMPEMGVKQLPPNPSNRGVDIMKQA